MDFKSLRIMLLFLVAVASAEGDVISAPAFDEAVRMMYHGKGQMLAAMIDALAPGDKSVNVNEQVAMPSTAGGGTVTPLLVSVRAAAQGKSEGLAVARALLARDDIDVNLSPVMPSKVKATPLTMAVYLVEKGRDGAMEIVRSLLARGADVNAEGMILGGSTATPMWIAADLLLQKRTKHPDAVADLIELLRKKGGVKHHTSKSSTKTEL